MFKLSKLLNELQFSGLRHLAPYLENRNSRRPSHNNIFHTHWVCGIGGPRVDLWDWNIRVLDHYERQRKLMDDVECKTSRIPYFKTATSDSVVYTAGPELRHGIFAIISIPFSFFISRALLKPPSIFSIALMGDASPPAAAATSQRASRSNFT